MKFILYHRQGEKKGDFVFCDECLRAELDSKDYQEMRSILFNYEQLPHAGQPICPAGNIIHNVRMITEPIKEADLKKIMKLIFKDRDKQL